MECNFGLKSYLGFQIILRISDLMIYMTKTLESNRVIGVHFFCKHRARESSLNAKIVNSVQFTHRILAFYWLLNNMVSMNQPNLLFWWRENC